MKKVLCSILFVSLCVAKPPIGIQNLNAENCFIIAVIQSLYQIPPFVQLVKEHFNTSTLITELNNVFTLLAKSLVPLKEPQGLIKAAREKLGARGMPFEGYGNSATFFDKVIEALGDAQKNAINSLFGINYQQKNRDVVTRESEYMLRCLAFSDSQFLDVLGSYFDDADAKQRKRITKLSEYLVISFESEGAAISGIPLTGLSIDKKYRLGSDPSLNNTYRLKAIVADTRYHAIAFVHNDGIWYLCNDSSVTPNQLTAVENLCNGKGAYKPYLLFYEKEQKISTESSDNKDLTLLAESLAQLAAVANA